MLMANGLVSELKETKKFFDKTASVFAPDDAPFTAKPDLYTVAGHIAHAADTVDWFMEGAFGKGWDMEFDALIAKAKAVKSLDEATKWLDKAFANAISIVERSSDEELMRPIADKRIMDGAPRMAVVHGITDHTAHHRGALAVYARLIGKTPPMPYA